MTDEEKKPYHDVMVASWRIFIKDRQPKRFSDGWWEEIIGDYDKLREPYKGNPMDDYVCHINQAFLDELERIQRRDRSQEVSTRILSKDKGGSQKELHCSAAVPEMGGSQKADEPLSAADWG